jgi:hypothetical protein
MGPPPYRQRLLTFLGLREELARRCPDAEYFDLRFKDRIFVKHRTSPAPGASAPGPAALPPKPEAPREVMPIG